MKTFSFKLQTVLELRARAETQAQMIHAEAGRSLEAALAAVAEVEADCQALIDAMSAMQRATFKPADREISMSALRGKQQLAAKLKQTAEAAAKDLEDKRLLLLKARAEHEAMIRLRDKAKLAHQREFDLRDAAAIDDIVNARHAAIRRPGAKIL